jgi:dihydroneopterin aldolase
VGTLFIRSLPVDCIIGIHPHERASRQRLLISLTLGTDFSAMATDDDIEQALDYTVLADRIETFARTGHFRLIETLAERLADDLFEPPMENLEIEVIKPAALENTREVGVRVERTRKA